eukprot:13266785-Ditylum_brightwellii.AAC.1
MGQGKGAHRRVLHRVGSVMTYLRLFDKDESGMWTRVLFVVLPTRIYISAMPKKWAKFKAYIKEWLEICHQASKSNEESVFCHKDLKSGRGFWYI